MYSFIVVSIRRHFMDFTYLLKEKKMFLVVIKSTSGKRMLRQYILQNGPTKVLLIIPFIFTINLLSSCAALNKCSEFLVLLYCKENRFFVSGRAGSLTLQHDLGLREGSGICVSVIYCCIENYPKT